MNTILYIHTPDYPPLKVSKWIILLKTAGRLQDYDLRKFKDGSAHLVHKNYRRYTIKVLGLGKHSEFDERTAKIAFLNQINAYPDSIVELYTQDWKGDVIDYTWHKNFSLKPFKRLKVPKSIPLPPHPYKEYYD